MVEVSDEFKELVERIAWRDIACAPKDGTFILLWCQEDGSRWLASWQSDRWYGVDDLGLTRQGQSAGDPDHVTGWFLDAWMPLPAPPHTEREDGEGLR
ncbi:MAG: hypothetical protein LC750_00635 [Actinobacteria bacterium]|nr:hypothetical protein [Actinomycetota bacterium]